MTVSESRSAAGAGFRKSCFNIDRSKIARQAPLMGRPIRSFNAYDGQRGERAPAEIRSLKNATGASPSSCCARQHCCSCCWCRFLRGVTRDA